MDALKEELKKHIIEELNLQDVTPDDIIDDAPLFGEGLGLDSIDALELIVIMENYYGIPITDASVGKEILYSIDTMAAYIVNNKPA
ncbi:MAG: acyl carrier protein [Lewinellaceae bacterium]|nr:acyl carrier protein [Lewinellaceae bacterium]